MRPRPHHYRFAHHSLPRTLLTEEVGRTWMSLLAGPAGPLLLRRVWDDVAAALPAEHRLDGGGFAVAVHETKDDRILAVVTLPPVTVELEAHMVAVVAAREDWSPQRYLTLESGTNALTGEPATFVAAIRPGGGRHAFGAGPEPDAEAFAGAVCGHLGLRVDAARPSVRYE